jgi:outer membrane protease
MSMTLGILILALGGPPSQSEPSLVFSAQAGLGMLAGNTTFGLKLSQFDPDLQVWVTGESELAWSVDFPMARVDISLSDSLAERSHWAVGLRFAINITDPLGTMDDSDWVSAYELGVPRTKFSYTESVNRGRALLFELTGRLLLYSSPAGPGWFALDLVAGYRHEYYDFNAYGADGWQLDQNGNQMHLLIDDSVHAVHYQSHHLLPFAGVSLRNRFFERLLLDSRLNLMGVISLDSDRHVIRNKQMDGRAYGLGVQLDAFPRWEFEGGFSFGLDLRLQYLYGGWGTLEQHYYADDPGLPGDQTNEKIPDADFKVTSLHFMALVVGMLSF